MSDLDEFKQRFYEALQEVYEKFNELRTELVEYRKTVNNAISILSKEQLNIEEWQIKDREDRKRGRKRQDIKDGLLGCVSLFVLVISCSMIGILIYLVYR